jgi:hypothetical protein
VAGRDTVGGEARYEVIAVIPTWSEVLDRYRTPTRLQTRARRTGFSVVSTEENLHITPDSSGVQRNLTRADFETAAPLLGRSGRGEVNAASRNSSYVEAILRDFRHSI